MCGRASSLARPRYLKASCTVLLLGLAGEASADGVPASERAALIALYNSTNGAGWTNRARWRNADDTDFAPPGTECTWAGVDCGGGYGHVNVTFLDLGANQLSGPIPPEIGGLPQLRELYLGVNHLTGAIPPEIGDLGLLWYLDLAGNELTGSIPPEIEGLTTLISLSLSGNQLSSVPNEIAALDALSGLYLSDNQLSSIPREVGSLTNLRALFLGGNQLSSLPAEIGNLTNLTVLDLGANELTGPIPPWIGNLTNLGVLDLGANQLTGTIPPWIGNLTNLGVLDLGANQLTGSIPPEIGNLRQLRFFLLHDNLLSGPIPPEIGSLSNNMMWEGGVEELRLDHNLLTGPIPPEIGRLKIGFTFMDFTNTGTLRLDHNRLSGAIPDEIGSLLMGATCALGGLYLDHNELSGPIPYTIGSIGGLGTLALNDNQLTGPIPTRFEVGDYCRPGYLYLDNNELTGPIPREIGDLSYLRRLGLSGNHLSGRIPDTIGNLTRLLGMDLAGNQLSGPIPATLATLTSLEDGSSDLRWNALHTSDAGLRAFLDAKQEGGDWEATQTVAPVGLVAESSGLDGARLSWSPILYTGDAGGYRVWYGTLEGGPYNLGGTTADKTGSSAILSGLSPGTTYHFALDALTAPHANNPNTVVSERTAEASATTTPGGPDWHALDVLRAGPGAVSSSPGGIACGGACSATFAPGTLVNLTAAPDAGIAFGGWAGACAGTSLTCELTMDAAKAVTAFFIPPPVSFHTVTPCRAYDSRDAALGGPAPLAAGTDNPIVVGGHCGVPATAKAVALNVAVVGPSRGGHLRLFASGTPRPGSSSLNYAAGVTRANNAVVSLGADGALVVYVNQPDGTVDVVLDVSGYFQ